MYIYIDVHIYVYTSQSICIVCKATAASLRISFVSPNSDAYAPPTTDVPPCESGQFSTRAAPKVDDLSPGIEREIGSVR